MQGPIAVQRARPPFAVFACVLCAALSSAVPSADGGVGRRVMEEYRRDPGHWLFLQEEGMVDHMVQHIGANGIAVAGFFIDKKYYDSKTPSTDAQARDPLFSTFRQIAQDQRWAKKYGMGHKTWTFGYGHDRELATNVGCEDFGTRHWKHACIVFWKTSPDGGSLGAHHTVWFGHDLSLGIVPDGDDIKRYIKDRIMAPVANDVDSEL